MTRSSKKSSEDIVKAESDDPIQQPDDPEIFPVDLDSFHDMVAERAYYKAEERDFEPGQEWDDWLEAERELLGVPPALGKEMD
jgi:hypothetical protein